MKKIDFKKNIFPLIVTVAVFVIAAIVYCKPVLKGMVIGTGDHINGFSAVQESLRYTEQTGNYSWWNGAVFSGMPNYQIGGGRYKSSEVIGVFQDFFHKGHDNAIFTVIFYLLAFFILLRAFGVERKLAAAGAFAIAFSSYFMIIIGAAHGGKTSSISWMTLVLVGMLLTYRKKYGWGCVMTMFFMSMGYTPHPQMAYYVCLLIGVMFCAELYIHIEEKRMKEWAVATVLFVASLAVGFGTNMGNTFANQEYMTQTMRGGHSDLVREGEESPASGLDLEYATSWSYGIDETLTFLIPNFMGGSSAYDAGTGSQLYKELINNGAAPAVAREFCSSAPMYWGDQAFTAGPVYIGAIVFLLFILGLMIVKGPYKWALLVATLFSVCLSWGYHFMPLTKLFFNYFPLYNKFRAVSSILIVAEITMPLLGFLAIREIWEKKIPVAELLKKLLWATVFSGGICLFVAIAGKNIFSFSCAGDAQYFNQIPEWLAKAIVAQRGQMQAADAVRSLIFILLGALAIFFFAKEKLPAKWFAPVLGVLIIADMWPVDRRYFNDSHFTSPRTFERQFALQPYEEVILQDKDPHFRVFNLSQPAFSENRTSYYLKSIGGYSAAKLRRYQDLIDEHLQYLHFPVVNMLNAKYLIGQGQDGQIVPQYNPDAMGNAWFVDEVMPVAGANAESDALMQADLRHIAVVDTTVFGSFVAGFPPSDQSNSDIVLTEYAPDRLEYDMDAANDGVAVFSEIYYPFGWKAYIDDVPAEHFRVNYVLRAMNVPKGKHHIKFEFRPDSVRKGDNVSMIFILIMLLSMVGFAAKGIYDFVKIREQ